MMKGHFGAVLLILAGILLLLDNLGIIQFSFIELLKTWWPVLLIAVGIALFFTPGDPKKPE